MSTTSPFLALPREIRDMIYCFLHQEVTLKGSLEIGLKERPSRATVRLDNAPLVSVLRTHPQIAAEYREAKFFRSLSATLVTSYYHSFKALAPDSKALAKVNHRALARVRNFTVLIWNSHAQYVASVGPALARELTTINKDLCSLRFIVRALCGYFPYSEIDRYITKTPKALKPIPDVEFPPTLEGLHLTSRGEGFRLGSTCQLWQSLDSEHDVHHLAMSCYTRDGKSMGFWEPGDESTKESVAGEETKLIPGQNFSQPIWEWKSWSV
ncbi:hypothetical protein FB567DRAFT_553194 [Paraphoma chrysanthemicola]|uniref:F-box domain-containing protein n=1 Tax=Paraphoma chrysanthemicola TaxID=798071 RepID=A0A8K0QY28_9PLEO|nr:hypothetical protein FB567DRAFT_553194 [Paraphoma chrysanthemicola]